MLITKSKKILVVVLVIVLSLFLAIAGAVLFFNSDENNSNQEQNINQEQEQQEPMGLIEDGPCSRLVPQSIISDSVRLFLASNTTNIENIENQDERPQQLQDMKERILKEQNYLNDANCLHILTMISLEESNSEDAERYLSLLEIGLSDSDPESYILDENVNFYDVETMNEIVTGLKENNSRIQIDDSLDGVYDVSE